jgi:hypothetical protein
MVELMPSEDCAALPVKSMSISPPRASTRTRIGSGASNPSMLVSP